jgi:hypothetical protein
VTEPIQKIWHDDHGEGEIPTKRLAPYLILGFLSTTIPLDHGYYLSLTLTLGSYRKVWFTRDVDRLFIPNFFGGQCVVGITAT